MANSIDEIDRKMSEAADLRSLLGTPDVERLAAAWRSYDHLERTDIALLLEIADAFEAAHRFDLLDGVLGCAVEAAADDMWLAVRHARLAFDIGDIASALGRATTLIARFPTEGIGHLLRGEFLENTGHIVEAEDCYRTALRLQPQSEWCHIRFAEIAGRRGDLAAEMVRLQDAYLALPDNPLIAQRFSSALQVSGRRDEAGTTLLDAMIAHPGDDGLRALYVEQAVANGDLTTLATNLRNARYTGSLEPLSFGHDVFGVLVSRDPPIIHAAVYSFKSVVAPVMQFYEPLGCPVYFLFGSLMSLQFHDELRARFPQEVQDLTERFPQVRIKFLVNDVHELNVARSVGLDAEVINNNAFTDESLYRILPDVEKQYDVVYNARFHPYKRHELAVQLDRLLLLMANPEPADAPRIAAMFPSATVNNTHLSSQEVTQFLNGARCGLCLSSAEGAMYASMEYMLCGLPVVTTRSIGGRDWFFSDDYVIYCEADPRAVRDAVASTLARQISPEFIRDATLARIERERLAFFALLERIFDEYGQPRRAASEFRSYFSDKANYTMRPISQLLAVPSRLP